MKINFWLALFVISLFVFVASSCNRASYGADDKSKPHIGIVFDIGGKDDRSFNAAAWAGVKCAETGMMTDGKTSCGKPDMDKVLREDKTGHTTAVESVMWGLA